MKNKFLEKYPKLREPKQGDSIKIIETYITKQSVLFNLNYYSGDTGIIELIFRHSGQKRYIICLDRTQCRIDVGRDEFIIIINNEK